MKGNCNISFTVTLSCSRPGAESTATSAEHGDPPQADSRRGSAGESVTVKLVLQFPLGRVGWRSEVTEAMGRGCSCADEMTVAAACGAAVEAVAARLRRHVRRSDAARDSADYLCGLLAVG